MVLRRIFGPLMEEVSADCRKLPNVELHDLYLSPNSMKMITPRRGYVQHVACIRVENNKHSGFCWGNMTARDPFQCLAIHGKIILRWIYKKQDGRM